MGRLRFKIVSSFVIAAFGLIMVVRLGEFVSLSPSTLIYFVAPLIFMVGGVWRGIIFLKAARGPVRT